MLAILFRRPEIKWKMLATIIGTLIECAEKLHEMLCERVSSLENIFFGETGGRFSVRLQIFSLFLEGQYPDIRTPTILSIKEFKLMPKLIRLLNETEAVLTMKAGKCQYTPKWLSQMILLIDLYEKVVILTRRRNEMHRITTNTWKWYDVASGKWNAYSVSNNKLINDAYWAGESSVRVSVGRHRYTINFNCMSQVNEETGNHRPVVLGLLSGLKRFPERVSATLSYIFGSDNEELAASAAASASTSTTANTTSTNTITTANTAEIEQDNTATTSNTSTCNNPAVLIPTPGVNQMDELDKTTTAAICEMRVSHRQHLIKTDYTQSLLESGTLNTLETPPISSEDVKLLGLEEFSTGDIVATCVRLMSPNILADRDALHALMKLCVRLTTKYDNAEIFAREGGIKLLLEMKQSCGYIGFSTLANLLIRHTLEEPRTLAMAMEKVIAARTLQTIPPGYRDLIFMLRRMSSAVARDPEVFKQVARSMLRIDVNALRRGVFSDDNRLIMKSISPPNSKRSTEKPNESSMAVKVITDLLQALIVPVSSSQLTTTATSKEASQDKQAAFSLHTASIISASTSTHDANDEPMFQHRRPLAEEDDLPYDNLPYDNSTNESSVQGSSTTVSLQITNIPSDQHRNSIDITGINLSVVDRNHQQNLNGNNTNTIVISDSSARSKQHASGEAWNASSSKSDSEKPLLPKSTILKALAEAVRSYQSVGIIIAEYTYQPQPKTLIRKAQPALAFILDTLLPSTEQNPDRDCSAGARMLIAALSAATDSQVTQYTVVTEVRAAIVRALSWPEVPEKHQQLQLLTALIPTMIENCPPDNPALMRLHQHQPRRNDIFNIMVRKGLIGDLANITQNLDLSSPHTVVTIGTALKSLEQLLRMSNQPVASVSLQLNKNRNNEIDSSGNSNVRQISRRQLRTISGIQPVSGHSDANTTNAHNEDDDVDEDDDDDDEDEDDDDDDDEDEDEDETLHANTPPISTPSTSLEQTAANNENQSENVAADPTISDNITSETTAAPAQQSLDSVNEIRDRTVNIVAQAMGSTMEELMEHFLEPVLDAQPQVRQSTTANRGSVTAAVVNATNSASVHQPMELTEERYIMDEDDSSSESDSNGSDENDEEREEEMEDDENEDEAEDRSELDVDEETRQFIEMYDHVYGRNLSPSIPELERDSEDILMIQYADNSRNNGPNSNNGNGKCNSIYQICIYQLKSQALFHSLYKLYIFKLDKLKGLFNQAFSFLVQSVVFFK